MALTEQLDGHRRLAVERLGKLLKVVASLAGRQHEGEGKWLRAEVHGASVRRHVAVTFRQDNAVEVAVVRLTWIGAAASLAGLRHSQLPHEKYGYRPGQPHPSVSPLQVRAKRVEFPWFPPQMVAGFTLSWALRGRRQPRQSATRVDCRPDGPDTAGRRRQGPPPATAVNSRGGSPHPSGCRRGRQPESASPRHIVSS